MKWWAKCYCWKRENDTNIDLIVTSCEGKISFIIIKKDIGNNDQFEN